MKVEQYTVANCRPDLLPAMTAAVVASLLVLAFSLAHRAVVARLTTLETAAPIARDLLQQLPMQIGDWVGENVSLDEDMVRRTDSDSYVNRCYSRRGGRETVTLYIVCGVNTTELLSHHPENCYSGAGWRLAGSHVTELPVTEKTVLPCSIFEYVLSGVGDKSIMTLLYVILDGQHYSGIPAVRWKVWRRQSAVRYAAEIQIITPTRAFKDDIAARTISEFAVDSWPFITRLFDNIRRD